MTLHANIKLDNNSSDESEAETAFADEFCWHSKKTARIIHTQNITFNKYPGQNIRGKATILLTVSIV